MGYCLYNGEKFPDIYDVYTPELQEEYPHALIWGGLVGHSLYLSPVPLIRFDNGGIAVSQETGNVTLRSFYTAPERVKWTPGADYDLSYDHLLFGINVWTNTPIYNEDGTLYLAASDPVPVLNPAVMMQGFMVGQAIRRGRK
jgi:hypothetical protein